jgi:hypothetical protein
VPCDIPDWIFKLGAYVTSLLNSFDRAHEGIADPLPIKEPAIGPAAAGRHTNLDITIRANLGSRWMTRSMAEQSEV